MPKTKSSSKLKDQAQASANQSLDPLPSYNSKYTTPSNSLNCSTTFDISTISTNPWKPSSETTSRAATSPYLLLDSLGTTSYPPQLKKSIWVQTAKQFRTKQQKTQTLNLDNKLLDRTTLSHQTTNVPNRCHAWNKSIDGPSLINNHSLYLPS